MENARPKIVTYFEVLQFSALAFGMGQSYLMAGAVANILPPVFMLGLEGIVALAMVWLILAVTRRKSQTAKWLLITAILLSVPFSMYDLFAPSSADMAELTASLGITNLPVQPAQNMGRGLDFIQIGLQLACLPLLFMPSFRRYLKTPHIS